MSDPDPVDAAAADSEIRDFVRRIRDYQRRFARSGDGQPHRGFHVKSHACVRARFEVLKDIPTRARHGVFRQPRVFDAWVRLTNGFSATRPDWFPDLHGCSVKLLGVDGPTLMTGPGEGPTQDFLALNQPYLPARNAAQLVLISTAAANVVTAPFKLIGGLGLPHALEVFGWTLGWSWRHLSLRSVAAEDFYGIAPISIGPRPVKFSWRSRQGRGPSPPGASWRNFLRDDLRARLAQGELRFDFMVQFWADARSTPVEGAGAWSLVAAPPVKLAELTIPPCDLESPQATRDERYVNGLSFNPWHGLVEHRPVGDIQRARGVVYRASADGWGHADDPEA